MASPKKPKAKPLPVNTENIAKAAQTNAIRALVALADAFNRVALFGPFETELPMFCSVYVGGEKQQYRKDNISIGTPFMPASISMGKRAGLIFAFTPTGQLQRQGAPIERIEIGWDDLINNFGELADQIEDRLNRDRHEKILVSSIDEQIKAVIAKNPSMHKILTEGFAVAQTHAKQDAADDSMEEIPGFGIF